jgi:L-alanine-DL-glutamate epimerase-like enolase superfamily enzyme
LICEFVAEEGTTLRDRITRQRVRAKDGYLAIPSEPGLGIDLDEDVVAQYRIC